MKRSCEEEFYTLFLGMKGARPPARVPELFLFGTIIPATGKRPKEDAPGFACRVPIYRYIAFLRNGLLPISRTINNGLLLKRSVTCTTSGQ